MWRVRTALGIAAAAVLHAALIADSSDIITRIDRSPLASASRREIVEAYKSHDFVRAEKLLVSSIDKSPRSPELLAIAGMLFLADGQPLNAAIALKKADTLQPLAPEDKFRLCLAYIGMKRGDWARPELVALSAHDPANASYIYWLARLDYDGRKYEEAVKRLRQVIQLDPNFARAYDNLGLNLEALGKIDEAAAAYRSAIVVNRRQAIPSAWPPLNGGTLFLRLGNLQEARAALDEAALFDPRSAQVHYNLGKLSEQERRPAQAIEEFKRAADLDKNYPDPWWALGRLLRRSGRNEEAKKAIAEFQRLKSMTAHPGR